MLGVMSCVMECKGETERAIKCTKVVDGVGTCTWHTEVNSCWRNMLTQQMTGEGPEMCLCLQLKRPRL